jgi:hypothetical protein
MADLDYKCPARGCNETFSKRSAWSGHCMAHARRGELIAKREPIIEGELTNTILTYFPPKKSTK